MISKYEDYSETKGRSAAKQKCKVEGKMCCA